MLFVTIIFAFFGLGSAFLQARPHDIPRTAFAATAAGKEVRVDGD